MHLTLVRVRLTCARNACCSHTYLHTRQDALSGNGIDGLDLGASLDCTVYRPTQWRNIQVRLESLARPCVLLTKKTCVLAHCNPFDRNYNENSLCNIFEYIHRNLKISPFIRFTTRFYFFFFFFKII